MIYSTLKNDNRLMLLLIISISVFSIYGCSTTTNGDLKSISGNVTIHNEVGERVAESGDVKVTLTNTDAASGTNNIFTTTTLDDGTFEFSDIPGGAYEISFERAGLATFKVPTVDLENNDLNNINVNLSELPSHNIEALEANIVPFGTDNSDGSVSSIALQLNLTVTNFLTEDKNVTRRLFYIFWNENGNVSNTNFDEKTLLVATNDSPDVSINNLDANVFFSQIPSGFINNIPAGSEFHIALYEVTENDFFYTDPESNSRIYSNMSEIPEVISVTNTIQ